MKHFKKIEYKGNTLTLQTDKSVDCIAYEIALSEQVIDWRGIPVCFIGLSSDDASKFYCRSFSDEQIECLIRKEYDDCLNGPDIKDYVATDDTRAYYEDF
jgi:hypothetical protein